MEESVVLELLKLNQVNVTGWCGLFSRPCLKLIKIIFFAELIEYLWYLSYLIILKIFFYWFWKNFNKLLFVYLWFSYYVLGVKWRKSRSIIYMYNILHEKVDIYKGTEVAWLKHMILHSSTWFFSLKVELNVNKLWVQFKWFMSSCNLKLSFWIFLNAWIYFFQATST